MASLATIGCRPREPEYRSTATIKDIMDSLVDPSADVLWDSVATVVSAAGVEEKVPSTDEEWAEVHRGAVRLVEATNLLLMPDRHVARTGEKAEHPEIELGPEEIERRINADRAAWTTLAHGLYDAALPALRAAEARNVKDLFDAGDKIDNACESCHLRYWYPPATKKTPPSRRAQPSH